MASLKYLGRAVKSVLTNSYGVHFCDVDCAEEMIFPEEKFVLRDCLDSEGKSHHFFKGYEVTVPSFYVRSLKNGLCYTSGEEVYTNEGHLILEHATQKNPPVRWRRFLKNITYVKGKTAVLKQDGCGNNYYHWLVDILPELYAILKSSFCPDFYVIDDSLPFQKQWLTLLGIKKEQIIGPGLFIQTDELIVPDLIFHWHEVEFRKHKSYHRYCLPSWITGFYKENVLPRIPRQTKKNIYVSRQNAPYRRVLNENELLPVLNKYDFAIVHPENFSAEKQIEIFFNAKAIVGLHGAGLTNAIFSDKGTPVLELNTQYYHDSSYRVLFSQAGQRYYYMVGETGDISMHPQKENVYIDPGKFALALEMMMEA